MDLEIAIQQKSFKSPQHKLLINLLFTTNWLENKLINILRPYDITLQQYNILRILRGQYPQAASMTILSERMLDRSSNVTRLVDKLLEKKLVHRMNDRADRRKQMAMITEAGLALLVSIDKNASSPDNILNGFSEEDALCINELLDKLRLI